MTESLALLVPCLGARRWLRIGSKWAKLAGERQKSPRVFTKPRMWRSTKSSD
jgi:hypothetical protein